MGNCQDQFINVDQYEYRSDLQKSQVLIDKTHKSIFPTKYQKNVGYLLNQRAQKILDNQKMHKSVALNLQSKFIKKSNINVKKDHKKPLIQYSKIQQLNLTFYHSLGLQQYTYPKKDVIITKNQFFVDQTEDKMGVIYIGQRDNNGKFNGNGILKTNTVQYIGQFREGTKYFHGRQIYSHQVYQGQFKFDLRMGKGKLYTEQYVDTGIFDKFIIKGLRQFYNGDQYYGKFKSNLMHGKQNQDKQKDKTWYYKDNLKNLFYEGNLEFQYGQLIKADKVYSIQQKDKKTLIGKYQNGKITTNQQQNLNKQQNKDKDKSLSQQQNKAQKNLTNQFIKKAIEQW